jgi:hypothetical protein
MPESLALDDPAGVDRGSGARPGVRADPWNARKALAAVFVPQAPLVAALGFRRPAALYVIMKACRGDGQPGTTRYAAQRAAPQRPGHLVAAALRLAEARSRPAAVVMTASS